MGPTYSVAYMDVLELVEELEEVLELELVPFEVVDVIGGINVVVLLGAPVAVGYAANTSVVIHWNTRKSDWSTMYQMSP